MIQVNIRDLKAHFSRYLAKAAQGETIIVCKHNKPFVEINSLDLKAKPKKRILGSGKASVTVAPDCFEPWPKEYIDLFYGYGKASKADPLFWKP